MTDTAEAPTQPPANRSLRERAEGAYESATHRAGEFYSDARRRAGDAGRRAADTVEEYAITATLGGLALGLLVGALLPRTRREEEWIGPYGRQVTNRARAAAEAAREVGTDKLERFDFLKDVARDTAKRMLENAKDVAEEAGSAAARGAKGDEPRTSGASADGTNANRD